MNLWGTKRSPRPTPPHFNGFLIATPFSFSYFFSFVLLFVSVIRYCYGFYLAITLF